VERLERHQEFWKPTWPDAEHIVARHDLGVEVG
jgi:hypothetical protein